MIIVKNRELLIPRDEQYIGTVYDDNSDNRQFLIDRITPGGVDLANLVFTLDIEYSSGDKNAVALSKEISDKEIVITWPLTSSQLQVTGTAFINLRAVNNADGKVRWASFRAPVYIEDTIYTPGTYTGDLTELEQLEARFGLFTDAEEARVEAETERAAAEYGRSNAENGRVAAETAREAAFNSAIDDFNNDRQELKDMHDGAVQAATDAEIYKDLCEMYADIIVPVFHIDFLDGHLKYNDNATFTFLVNTTSGDLEYTYVPA